MSTEPNQTGSNLQGLTFLGGCHGVLRPDGIVAGISLSITNNGFDDPLPNLSDPPLGLGVEEQRVGPALVETEPR